MRTRPRFVALEQAFAVLEVRGGPAVSDVVFASVCTSWQSVFFYCVLFFRIFVFRFLSWGQEHTMQYRLSNRGGRKAAACPFFLFFMKAFLDFVFCFFSSDCLAKCHVLVSCGEHRYVVQYRGCGVGAEFVDRWCMLDFFVCVCFPLFFVVIWR